MSQAFARASAPAFVEVPAAEALPARIQVSLHTGTADFARFAPEWSALHETAVAASVFTSWVWQYHWWQVYGRDQTLRLLVAREGGEAVGILALYVQTVEVLGVRARILRFVGTGADTHPDDLGPVLAAEREADIALELARAALRLPDVDVVALSDIDPRSVFPLALKRAAAQARRSVRTDPCERIAYLGLPTSWRDYLQSLTSDRRTRLRGARRKVADHAPRFFVWEDAARLDEAVEQLATLHRRRWSPAGGSESFRSSEYLAFHGRIIESALARGWLRLYCLELDGEIAAITYCYRFRNRIYLMQAGFDPEKGKLNPGKVLLGFALEHAIGEGNEVFDFLRGEHRYKDQLATSHRTTVCVRVFRATLGGLAYRLRRVWLPLLKARLQRRPPPKLNV